MELMSSLLFCALVANLPQAFGDSSPDPDVKYTISKQYRQIPMPKKILLNINAPPLVNMVSDLQSVFMDMSCRKCINCMERAMKAYKTHYHVIKNAPIDEIDEHVLQLTSVNRKKRDSDTTASENTTIKIKRTKPKKKSTKSVTVTKYNADGDVFALKVKETNLLGNADSQNDTQVSTCQIYGVKKSFPCGTEEGESLLTATKRKVNKKNKKVKNNKTHMTASPKAKAQFSAFRKRQVDNSQVPDNFMTSIEDFY